MSDTTGERLYNLLPAVYRVRDADEGEPLRALLGVLETELRVIEDDVDQLYDNWFIETCAEWVVPYLGDLLGVRGLLPVENAAFSQRGRVANTLAYRRRKGTAAMLEQLARDVTGWPAHVVEFFQRLATTQYLNHVRLDNLSLISLHDANQLELVNGPFERAAHTIDVRHIDHGRGRYNIPNIGIFLWRLQSYAIHRGTARALATAGQYSFNPLGLDAPLFNAPRTETDITQLAAEENVPGMLRRRALHHELAMLREAIATGKTPHPIYFGVDPALQVFMRNTAADPFEPILPEEMQICNLSISREPTSPLKVAVDPLLGRLAFPASAVPDAVQVSYAYGFSGDLGGGPYDRRDSVAQWLDPIARPVTWQIGVTQDADVRAAAPDPTQLTDTIQSAVGAWKTYSAANPGGFGVIAIMDSSSYVEALTATNQIELPAGSTLAIVAADWPLVAAPESLSGVQRVVGQLAPSGMRPHLQGNISIRGTAPAESIDPGALIIDGLLIEGACTILVGNLGSLRLAHSTLVPTAGGLVINAGTQAGQQNQSLTITIERSISGPLAVTDTIQSLQISDSIIDGGAATAITAPATRIESSTILGAVAVRSLEASNSIFRDNLIVERRQVGCVRFCYLPLGSRAPRRYRCQPANAAVASRIVPAWTSVTYGDPAYGQLAATGPDEIRTGADDEGELGVFHFLQQTQRFANLQASLTEYLRFGLEAGIFFVT